jgi:hypothetical protein
MPNRIENPEGRGFVVVGLVVFCVFIFVLCVVFYTIGYKKGLHDKPAYYEIPTSSY